MHRPIHRRPLRVRLPELLRITPADRARLLDAEDRLAAVGPWVVGVMVPVMVLGLLFFGWRSVGVLVQPAIFAVLDLRLRRTDRPDRLVAVTLLLSQLGYGVTIALTGAAQSPYLALVAVTALAIAPRFRVPHLVLGTAATVVIALVAGIAPDPAGFLAAPLALCCTVGVSVLVAAFAGVIVNAEFQHAADAVLDPLTGLPNRKALAARSRELAAQAHRENTWLSAIALDLDGFKAVNDRLGHAAGDAVLVAVTAVLRGQLRPYDAAYRLGGDELVVLLPGLSPRQAVTVAERVRAQIEGVEDVTASCGVAGARGTAVDVARLCREADQALLAAKRAGRNRVVAAERAGDTEGLALAAAQ